MRRIFACLSMGVLAVSGCKKHGPGSSAADQSHRYGVRIAEDGVVAKVTTSSDGSHVAFLGQAERSKVLGVPEGTMVGLLELVATDGKSRARQLLGGVTNLPGGFGFSPDGKVLAALKSFRFVTHSGTLETVKVAGGEPVQLADDCSGFVFSPDGLHLAWVCRGGTFWGNADGSSPHKVTDGGATAEFSRDGKRLLVRTLASAGGELLTVDVAGKGEVRTLAKKVGDYAFAPNGTDVAYTVHDPDPRGGWDLKLTTVNGTAPRALGQGVSNFRFSPDGKWLGYIAGVTPSKAFGDLYLARSDGDGAGKKIGGWVDVFRFSPRSNAVAYLARYDPNARSGTLTLQTLPMAGPPLVLHKPVKGFEWSPKGTYLAYSALILKPAVSVDLHLLPLAELKPGAAYADGGAGEATGSRAIGTGVFGFGFVDEDRLLYRTDCIMSGRACDLYEVPTARPATPARLTGGVWAFTLSADRTRMLITYPRVDSESSADLGAMNLSGYGGVVGIDHAVELGASFLDPQGDRVAYGVTDRHRHGVYVAKVPLPAAGQLPPNLSPPGFKATYSSTGALGGGR